jgi:Nucleotidyl transferase of unknown function (DUF2204)
MLITSDMIDFIKLLKQHKVKYALVGGFAVIYYGYVRTTQDIDILIFPSPENARRVLAALVAFGFGGAGFTAEMFEREGSAVHLGSEPNRIDILTSLKGVSNDVIFSRLKRIRHKGLSLSVISFADLLNCKRHSTRSKDLADVEALEETAAKKQGIHMEGKSPKKSDI